MENNAECEEEGINVMENNAEGGDDNQREEKQNTKKYKHVYPYGNFKNYYAHRNGTLDEDPRLKLFKKEWFEGKDCLDIGCNSGILTIHIAQKFCCRSILGIDIDADRIKDAYSNLSKTVQPKSAGNTPVEASKLKDKNHADNLEHGVGSSSNEEIPMELSSLEDKDLSDIVSFKQDNFVQSQYPPGKHYDTVLCLSVTQWIHLNWGDDGLITLFEKTWNLLRPGGILLLEPQPWKSYESKHGVSETTATNYQNIKIRPENFQEILLDKIGFRTVQHINPGWSNLRTRYNRPILIFQK